MVINENKNPPHVRFISYNTPENARCAGVLTLEIDGEIVEFGHGKPNIGFWVSGGSVNRNTAKITHGEWEIDASLLDEKYRQYVDEIDEVFNENVDEGCCGGCL